MQFIHRHRRTAFQAELLQLLLPRTSSPVTIATLSSAFQAQTLHLYKPISGQDTWSTIQGNGQLYSGNIIKMVNLFQDKTQPYICDGFEMQTIHSQPVWLQTVTRISAGLKIFSGEIMRNARARKHISVLSEARRQFSCKRVQSRTIALSQMSKIEFTRILPWRAIALLRTCSGYAERSRKCQENVCWKRTFVHGESRSQVYLDYAEPQPNVCWKRTKYPQHYFPLFASIT